MVYYPLGVKESCELWKYNSILHVSYEAYQMYK